MGRGPTSEFSPGQVDPVDLLEAVIFEDGLDAAIELAAHPHLVPGANAVTIPLMIARLLTTHAYDVLGSDDPFSVDEPDGLLGFLETGSFPASDPSAGKVRDADPVDEDPAWLTQLRRLEDASRQAHAVTQSAGAVRARSIAEFARWEHPDGPQGVTRKDWLRHGAGFTSVYAADSVAAELKLGTQAAVGLVERSAWMVTRTPGLLDEVAAGRANLDTVAAIATELQDAAPDVCETVESRLRSRGCHLGTRAQAARSTRTLVERCQPTAARTTRKRTKAQQTGVFQDPHPTPGLAMLTFIGDTERVTAMKDSIDGYAEHLKHREPGGTKLIGEYRFDAAVALMMQGVTFDLDIHILTPTTGEGRGGSADNGDAGGNGETGGGNGEGGARGNGSSVRGDVADLTNAMRIHGTVAAHARAGVIGPDGVDDLAARAAKVRLTRFEFDPATGQVAPSKVSDGYRPPAWLRRQVRTRDQRCRAPGCHRPAARETDLDHAVPWPAGPTAEANLHCLCRRHHRMKQAGWTVRLEPNGDSVWTSPTGRTYRTRPGLVETWHDLTDDPPAGS